MADNSRSFQVKDNLITYVSLLNTGTAQRGDIARFNIVNYMYWIYKKRIAANNLMREHTHACTHAHTHAPSHAHTFRYTHTRTLPSMQTCKH